MTDQVNLDLVWASGGGTTPVSTIKYENGWIAEIPTYQNFNYMIQGLDQNILHVAESGMFDWQVDISYKAGAKVNVSGVTYYCHSDNTGTDPTTDSSETLWSLAPYFGTNYATRTSKGGLELAGKARTNNTWTSSDFTVGNFTSLLTLNTSGAATDNLLLGNIQGSLAVVEVGTATSPEGNKPTVSDIGGAVGEAPIDGVSYARNNAGWTRVTTTVVQSAPAPNIFGAGQGWYNLDDGQFYIDVNDGNSSQWVPANPPQIPVSVAEQVSYTGAIGSDVQAAIDALLAHIVLLEA